MTGDGEAATLTLKDFLDLKLTEGGTGGIRLAILSACETGVQGIELADEQPKRVGAIAQTRLLPSLLLVGF